MIKTERGREAHRLTPSPPHPTPQGTTPPPTMTATPTPRAIAPALTAKQRADLAAYVVELTREGRHLEASTLAAEFFPLV
jgi:hypothetical protein